MTRRCVYCLGFFDGRAHAETCSPACRKARSVALKADEVAIRPAFRRTVYSPERAAATGFGTMRAVDQYHADLRARLAAGLEVGELPPHGPGFGPDDIQFEYTFTRARRAS